MRCCECNKSNATYQCKDCGDWYCKKCAEMFEERCECSYIPPNIFYVGNKKKKVKNNAK